MVKYKHLNREILVAVECLECGCIVPTNITSHRYCPECFTERRRRKAREYQKRLNPHKYFPPKYCADCGVLLDESKWNKPHVKRCGICQFTYTQIKTRNENWGNPITVAVTCIGCGKIVITHSKKTKYCLKCFRDYWNNKPHLATQSLKVKTFNEQTKEALIYIKKANPQFFKECSVEQLGTHATSIKPWVNTAKMIKDNQGNPRWDKESEVVKKLYNKTFNTHIESYTKTEGDIKRNIVKEIIGDG